MALVACGGKQEFETRVVRLACLYFLEHHQLEGLEVDEQRADQIAPE